MSLGEALQAGGARRWAASAARAAAARTIAANQLEVAVLDRRRPGRTFRRITGAALTALLGRDTGAQPATGAAARSTPTVRGAGRRAAGRLRPARRPGGQAGPRPTGDPSHSAGAPSRTGSASLRDATRRGALEPAASRGRQ